MRRPSSRNSSRINESSHTESFFLSKEYSQLAEEKQTLSSNRHQINIESLINACTNKLK